MDEQKEIRAMGIASPVTGHADGGAHGSASQTMEPRPVLDTGRQAQAYRLERIPLEGASSAIISEWRELLKRSPSRSPMHDPDWLSACSAEGGDRIFVYLLYADGLLCGVAPFLLKNWPIKLQLGEVDLVRLPLNRLHLLGGTPHFPEDPGAYDLLFKELMSPPNQFDAVYLEDVPVDSFIWKFAQASPQLSRSLSCYIPEPPRPRVLLRLEGTFDEYLGSFSAKHRQTLRRKVRKFEQTAPETRSTRFSSVPEVDSFLNLAVEISKKTYQWNLLNSGLREPEKLKKHFTLLARRGWFRSYILFSGDAPCAFVVGYQFGGRYYLDDMGFDPAWKDFSVGTVLQLALIEDLHVHDRPEVYDLGEYGPHKEEFATDNYLQGKLFLFRRGMYGSTARVGHRTCLWATSALSSALNRFGVKQKLKKLVRSLSSRR